MSLSSRGCVAKIERVIETKGDKITAEITCFAQYVKNGVQKRFSDFTKQVVLINPNNEILNHGDLIKIAAGGFYIKNRDQRIRHQFDTIVITDWKLWIRNVYNKKYYKQRTNAEVLETKRKQRQAIEAESEAEEQDIDEYIDNNGEDGIPF
ncbi:MAG: hypothetical protein NC131_01175 [Roseburia sp.]|nr:hypothetical protein [Roseburia sp.]